MFQIRQTERVEHLAFDAITSTSIESANIVLTDLDSLGDSARGISTKLDLKIGWIDRGWRTIDENDVSEGNLDG